MVTEGDAGAERSGKGRRGRRKERNQGKEPRVARERSGGGIMDRVEKAFGGPPPASNEDRFQRAAADLEASTSEANQRLMAAVPDARTPEEAAARLEENQRLVDMEGRTSPGLLFPPDLADTLVQYRIRSHLDKREVMGPHETEIGRRLSAAKGMGKKRSGGLMRNGRMR